MVPKSHLQKQFIKFMSDKLLIMNDDINDQKYIYDPSHEIWLEYDFLTQLQAVQPILSKKMKKMSQYFKK